MFELPIEIVDRNALMNVIRDRATQRTPAPVTRNWLSYDPAPEGVDRFLASQVAEDASAARVLAERIREQLARGRAVAIDFSGIGIATQSFLHALLFQPVRVGWAMGARIYVVHAAPAVRSGLAYLESYALR